MTRTRTPLVLSLLLLVLAVPAHAADVTVTLPAGDGFVVKDNTGAIERLRVDEATGNISRNGALFVHTTGTDATFVGQNAGNSATTGLSNSAFGHRSLYNSATGGGNSAFGSRSLYSNTGGSSNSAFGSRSLYSNTGGNRNSAFGNRALPNSSSSDNSAFGADALYANTGAKNSAFGVKALSSNSSGFLNTAFGYYALRSNTTGLRNVALGRNAGLNQTTGSDNIYIDNPGVAGESGQIKIGNSAHTETFIEGIFGNTTSGGIAVFINSSNELGTSTSSVRFKQDVRDLGQTSELLMRLRPVAFRYKEEVADGEDVPRYGLIAEEVAEVAPELVALDEEGRPYSVRYHVLPSLLLNEMQKQQRTMESQAAEIESLRAQQLELLATLTTRIEHLEAGPQLARVEAIQ